MAKPMAVAMAIFWNSKETKIGEMMIEMGIYLFDRVLYIFSQDEWNLSWIVCMGQYIVESDPFSKLESTIKWWEKEFE